MKAGLVPIVDRLAARDADDLVFDLDIEVGFFDPRHFRNNHEIISLSERVDRRERAGARRAPLEPIALPEGIESLLKVEKRLEWIGEKHSIISLAV